LFPADTALLEQIPVSKIMHTRVITVHPLDPIDEAARLLYEHRIGCLPVIQSQQLVGIVTETDVLRRLVELTGATTPGSHLEVEVPDQPGMLAAIAEIIKEHDVNISSILTMPGSCERCLVLALRLQAMDLRPIIKGIKALGYRVLWPVELE
ncbi:MAG: CBS domain-containing protein, partial [Syntrophothermus sp.]